VPKADIDYFETGLLYKTGRQKRPLCEPNNGRCITYLATQSSGDHFIGVAAVHVVGNVYCEHFANIRLASDSGWPVGCRHEWLTSGRLAAWRGSMMQRPGSTYLSLDAENLTVSTNYKNHTIPWSDIKSIEAAWTGGERFQISWNKLVKIELIQTAGTFERLIGTNVLWIYPRLYGMNAEGLITQMEPYLTDSRRRG